MMVNENECRFRAARERADALLKTGGREAADKKTGMGASQWGLFVVDRNRCRLRARFEQRGSAVEREGRRREGRKWLGY